MMKMNDAMTNETIKASKNVDAAAIAVVGMAVMGKNLALNMADHGFRVCIYNRSCEKVEEILRENQGNSNLIGAFSLEQLVSCLEKPRKILLMVKSGQPADSLIDALRPLLEEGDILIDGGNSDWQDTERRVSSLREHGGILFVGCGISGGEEGARNGPSMMPGGNEKAWNSLKEIFQSISAKALDNSPCCQWMGAGGSGHFVKMVHNGIEYADMQVICEAYDVMRKVYALSSGQIASVFEEWNKERLSSYLVEITASILEHCDEATGERPVEQIVDVAGQKGTGKLTVSCSLEYGTCANVIAEAVYARILSGFLEERKIAFELYSKGAADMKGKERANSFTLEVKKEIRDAVYASKIIAYSQGFKLLQQASEQNNWNLNFQNISSIWRGGCIIRSVFLNRITEAYANNSRLQNLLFDEFFAGEIKDCLVGWRKCVVNAIQNAIPIPAIASSLEFFDGITAKALPMNLLQAMRDFFGAHTVELQGNPGVSVHLRWGVN